MQTDLYTTSRFRNLSMEVKGRTMKNSGKEPEYLIYNRVTSIFSFETKKCKGHYTI
jgi:hypothetical protein